MSFFSSIKNFFTRPRVVNTPGASGKSKPASNVYNPFIQYKPVHKREGAAAIVTGYRMGRTSIKHVY